MNKKISAVYKRELKLAFCSPFGWLFIAVNLLAVGVCTVWLNIRNGYTNYEYALESASLIFCVAQPLLCSLTLSREGKRGETELLLRYVSSSSLALGKYLAWLTLFSIPTVISAVLPLVLLAFGKLYLPAAYMGVLGYLLTGAAMLAMCLYIASAVRRPLLCFAISALAVLLLNISSNLSHITAEYDTVTFVICAVVLISLLTVALFFYLDNTVISVIFAAIGSAATILLTITDTIAPVMREVLMFISPQHAFSVLIYGTAALEGVIQPCLFTAIFLILTVLRHENRRRKES